MIEQEYIRLRPADAQTPVEGIEQLSEFLKARLSDLGYVAEPIQEDWGYWIAVRAPKTRMAIGVYGVDEGTPDRQYAVTVFTERSMQWIIWPFWGRSIETELMTLKRDLSKVLEDAENLFIVERSAEYPL